MADDVRRFGTALPARRPVEYWPRRCRWCDGDLFRAAADRGDLRRAKLEAAGGEAAFAALQRGPELGRMLAYAAEQSFQAIAVLPAVLFFVFGCL